MHQAMFTEACMCQAMLTEACTCQATLKSWHSWSSQSGLEGVVEPTASLNETDHCPTLDRAHAFALACRHRALRLPRLQLLQHMRRRLRSSPWRRLRLRYVQCKSSCC